MECIAQVGENYTVVTFDEGAYVCQEKPGGCFYFENPPRKRRVVPMRDMNDCYAEVAQRSGLSMAQVTALARPAVAEAAEKYQMEKAEGDKPDEKPKKAKK